MKPYYILFAALFVSHLSLGSTILKIDTVKKDSSKIVYASVEKIPEFPGGIPAFIKYLSRSVKYPEVAKLIGINGKVNVSFVVDGDGKIVNIMPMNCIGAGCEAEAADVLQNSPRWKPGIQNGKAVRVQFFVPISFIIPKANVNMKQLKKSDYGFVFDIKGTRYTIDEAEKILGKEFPSDQIEIADPFYNSDNIEKFKMPSKKEVYLLKMKS
ncbi:energy transducer TonB [Mucilaginibacter sp.]|uniref:energy transducer TonB n=1 Tax=Mucilaginibacter sp. TaxID=1882438 RepID=UPI0025F225A9|nr:energy transducer TonB [Mucilaginibacter sp.]